MGFCQFVGRVYWALVLILLEILVLRGVWPNFNSGLLRIGVIGPRFGRGVFLVITGAIVSF